MNSKKQDNVNLFRMGGLRDDKNELPGDFGELVNCWSLESITAIAIERRLNLLSGDTKDPRAKKLIESIRKFFILSFEMEMAPAIWKYYETKKFKEIMDIYDTMTK
jgi:cytochrome P450 family 12